jgi:hypothetical protein
MKDRIVLSNPDQVGQSSLHRPCAASPTDFVVIKNSCFVTGKKE